MKRILLAQALLAAGPAYAQELTLFAGSLRDSGTKQGSHAWAVEYQQGLGENMAASFSWLNEGHIPGHRRDGQAVQVWGRANVLDRRLSLAFGVGPYRYFDTIESSASGGYANLHGWGPSAVWRRPITAAVPGYCSCAPAASSPATASTPAR